MENFGSRLRTVRKEKNLTIAKLAEMCNSTEGVIRGYEKSRRLPKTDMMIRLCNALRVAPDYLLQDELDFNPCQKKDEVFSVIDKLTPKQFDFLKEFLETLKKQ